MNICIECKKNVAVGMEVFSHEATEPILLHAECWKTLNEKYIKLKIIAERTALHNCCMCCDTCVACDALDLLRELGVAK